MSTPCIALFDLGNVVVDWEPMRLYRSMFASEEEARAFLTDVANMAWHTEHDRGVPMAENASPLIAKYPQFERQIRAWDTGWMEMFHGYVPGIEAILADLRNAGVPLYALTNVPAEKYNDIADAFPELYRFEDTIISGVEKCVKPGREIFEITLKRIGAPAGNIFFTDDSQRNIDAADELGFVTHHFTDAGALRGALANAGLLPA